MSIFSIAIFFAFFSNKDPGMQYMLVLLPFILVFNLYAVIAIITAIHSKKSFGLVLLVLPVTYLAFKHYQTKDSLYFGENYKPKYSRALSALQPITRDQKEFLCFYPLRSYYIAKYNLNSKFEVISTETLLKRLSADTTSLTQPMTNGGYIGWTTFRTLKIPIEIREFTNKECRKIGGEGIDNTNIELYHFSEKAR
jgi:hypothetical protein